MFNLNAVINQDLKQWPNITIKREDAIHPDVSGNKYRKLHLNLDAAKKQGKTTLLTFGGAYSNHIAATAAAGALYGFKTIGVIRGEELAHSVNLNPTLSFAANSGMTLHFVSRDMYRNKNNEQMIAQLAKQYGEFYLIPEGGTNLLAIEGCRSILTHEDAAFDVIATAVGTGGTITGIIQSALSHQEVIGFPALRGDFLTDEIKAWLDKDAIEVLAKWSLNHHYHFGGYGKTTPELIAFINAFYRTEGILLDPIYTGKMVFGIIDKLNRGYLNKTQKILIIHTGGLQGIAGFNAHQKSTNKQDIIIL
ncbi:1-aminocyclopropane-1-carboxylate deaminase/D-cysteine desulfhydrase [Thorsellia anophelis]|uniref:1-aminocyclopropane-1-carboxylate deaminase n=1 Tax=Thorsellia anophelis DSM 18579 TaxID=1123402 RepID=A0A1H9Z958_9GAMM|nr:pyridoxal-phosphate dependent enzyme [Thorsellia anophelis]SES77403.1 1-aminocyclopropane-1-carboxylate deaminase [Thorsellia anophelis DSM 18579]